MADELQIGCYLLPEEAEALDAYARSFELSRPKLCALLVVRMVRSGKLASVAHRYGGSEPKMHARRVTTRLDDQSTKRKFIESAIANGLGGDDAAAMVFRAELSERWLERAIAA